MVLATVAVLKAKRRFSALQRLEAGDCIGEIVRMDEFEEWRLAQLLCRPAKHVQSSGVCTFEIAVGISEPENLGVELPRLAADVRAFENFPFKLVIRLLDHFGRCR